MPQDVYANPHLHSRQAFISPEHRKVSAYPMAGLAWKLCAVMPRVEPSLPLGQDNQYVYGQLLGLSAEEIDLLVKGRQYPKDHPVTQGQGAFGGSPEWERRTSLRWGALCTPAEVPE
ncbi:MAG: hypothetical protein V1724_04675 [Chloroflexota bacterium]